MPIRDWQLCAWRRKLEGNETWRSLPYSLTHFPQNLSARKTEITSFRKSLILMMKNLPARGFWQKKTNFYSSFFHSVPASMAIWCVTSQTATKVRYSTCRLCSVPNWCNNSDSNDYQFISLIPCYRCKLVPWVSLSKSGKALVARMVISSDPMAIFDRLKRKTTPPTLPPNPPNKKAPTNPYAWC